MEQRDLLLMLSISYFVYVAFKSSSKYNRLKDDNNPEHLFNGHTDGKLFWSLWGPWSPCSVTCASGLRVRSRRCYRFGSEEAANAWECQGDLTQEQPCRMNKCPNDQGDTTTEDSHERFGAIGNVAVATEDNIYQPVEVDDDFDNDGDDNDNDANYNYKKEEYRQRMNSVASDITIDSDGDNNDELDDEDIDDEDGKETDDEKRESKSNKDRRIDFDEDDFSDDEEDDKEEENTRKKKKRKKKRRRELRCSSSSSEDPSEANQDIIGVAHTCEQSNTPSSSSSILYSAHSGSMTDDENTDNDFSIWTPHSDNLWH